MIRFALAVLAALASFGAAFAQDAEIVNSAAKSDRAPQTMTLEYRLNDSLMQLAQANPIDSRPAISMTPDAPLRVTNDPVIVHTGTLAGNILEWMAAVLGPVLAGFAANWLLALAANLRLANTDKLRARLQNMIENAVAYFAEKAANDMKGRGDVEIKNTIAAQVIGYTQTHGAETIKALGIDPTSPKAEEAIRARIAAVVAPVLPKSAVAVTPS